MLKLILNFSSVFLLSFIYLSGEPLKTPRHVFNGIEERYLNHPGDYPFPTDMTFKKYADHCLDKMTESFDPDLVKQGDTIFLCDWYIPWFTTIVHPKIKHPYILISNDSDGWHPDPGAPHYNENYGWPPPKSSIRTLLYDPKVAAWFCKNMVLSRHPKIQQIPIGPWIIYWSNFSFGKILELSKKSDYAKKDLVFMSMNAKNHPDRQVICELFQNKPYVVSGSFPYSEFLDRMTQAKYTFAPKGLGPDTVRFWEAIYLDCIPIVKHCELDDLYADLPVLFVHRWEDVNEELLNQKYSEIKRKNWNREKPFFDFWLKKIKECQAKVRSGQNDFSNIEATKFSARTLSNLVKILEKNRSKKSKKSERLICKGAVLSLRPFQLAEACSYFQNVIIQDKWGGSKKDSAGAHLSGHCKDRVLQQQRKCLAISDHENPYQLALEGLKTKKLSVFLDLSYLRINLMDDLNQALKDCQGKVLICGNLYDDPYVREVLEMFSKQHGITIKSKEDIWYFVRR